MIINIYVVNSAHVFLNNVNIKLKCNTIIVYSILLLTYIDQ